jgi:hypothetical protein
MVVLPMVMVMMVIIIVTDLINALPGSNSVNTVHYAT